MMEHWRREERLKEEQSCRNGSCSTPAHDTPVRAPPAHDDQLAISVAKSASSPLRPIDMRARAKEDLGRLHYRFGQCWVRMNGESNIAGQSRHFNGEYAFGNHFAGPDSDDPDSKYALGLRIEDQLRHAFRTIESHGAPGRGPRE